MSQLLADLPDELPPEDDRPDAVDLRRKGKGRKGNLGRASFGTIWHSASWGARPPLARKFVPDWARDPGLLPKRPPGGKP